MVLGHSQDVECLQAIQTIMQSTVSLNFAERQLESNFLQGQILVMQCIICFFTETFLNFIGFGFDGFSQFAGPFYDQGVRFYFLLTYGVLE